MSNNTPKRAPQVALDSRRFRTLSSEANAIDQVRALMDCDDPQYLEWIAQATNSIFNKKQVIDWSGLNAFIGDNETLRAHLKSICPSYRIYLEGLAYKTRISMTIQP